MSELSMTGQFIRITPIQVIQTAKGWMHKRYLVLDAGLSKPNLHAFEVWDEYLVRNFDNNARITVFYDQKTTIYDAEDKPFKAYTSLRARRVIEPPKYGEQERLKHLWAETNVARRIADEDNPLNW